MKSLLEVQQDIRRLESSIHDIMDTIKNINLDIEELRIANQKTDSEYSKIEMLARQLTFGKHPLDKLEDDRACQVYLEMLLILVRLDREEELSFHRLVFIQWLQKEAKIDWSLEELLKDCYKINENTYHEMVDVIPKKYREFFIVDALIIANIGGAANAEINEYVAGLVSILGIDKERLKILSYVARAALCQNVNRVKKAEMYEFQKCAKAYKHYMKSDILKRGISSLRQVVVELSNVKAKNFKWKVKQGHAVKKGEVIATYSNATNDKIEEITAPCKGLIFQFRDNSTNYGVIAHETDKKDSIKAWVKARRRLM